MPLPASGGAPIKAGVKLVIRFSRQGCTNRPFYHIQLSDKMSEPWEQCIEQLGTYDPLPNERNEKLLSCNFERIRYWLGEGALLSKEAKKMLGIIGFLPIHPESYLHAWQARRAAELPEPPLPKKLTWRERKKILIQQAEDRLKAPAVEEDLEEESNESEQPKKSAESSS